MFLDKGELFDLINLLGHSPSDKDFTYPDIDKKVVSIPQFVKLMNEKISKIDEVMYGAFRMFDSDQSGFISPEELRVTLLQISNGTMSLEQIVGLVRTADIDHDGQINLEEFKKKIYPKGIISFYSFLLIL